MADETKASANTITGNMLFYKQPELLNIQEHSKLGLTPLTEQPYAFLLETQLVPITVTEFIHAAMNYPIVFAGEERSPAAVMGVKLNSNVFITDAGEFVEGAYIPAFVRRYPFASAMNNDDPGNMMICFDRASPMVTENSAAPFFEGNELSESTKQAVEFVKNYEAEAQGTKNFVRVMQELDMFETQDVKVAAPKEGETVAVEQKMGTYMGISDQKILDLAPEKLAELRDNGGLAAMYSHKMSQANWQRLLNMELIRDFKAQQNGGQA
ncbi:MAG: SapC family protein [Robiginitomaculum sp.]|nr:SapC family protein [Robiginitomaculum sp.]